MVAKKVKRRNRIRLRIRKKISGTAARPRLSVFRSNKDIYAQIIDDIAGHTIVATSSRIEAIKSEGGNKSQIAKLVGKDIAKLAKEKGVENVVFDRGGYLYHGRVKALAEGAREEGLKL